MNNNRVKKYNSKYYLIIKQITRHVAHLAHLIIRLFLNNY